LDLQQSYLICDKDFLFFTAEGAEEERREKRDVRAF